VKSLHWAASKLRGIFSQCCTAAKRFAPCLMAICKPVYASHLWCKCLPIIMPIEFCVTSSRK